MTSVDLAPDDPAVVALRMQYRRAYGLGDSFSAQEHIANHWRGIVYDGRVVAVFGVEEKDGGRTLHVNHAYPEPTRYGKIAACVAFLGYLNMVNTGAIDRLYFSVLAQNEEMMQAVIRETKRLPVAAVFEYDRGQSDG